MSNIGRAAEVIRKHGFAPCQEPECIAQDLAVAGLLTPDTDHPATLATEADFTHAPVGTIVTRKWRVAIKRGEDEWDVTGDDMRRRNDTVGDGEEKQ